MRDPSYVPHHLIAARIMAGYGVPWAFRNGLLLGNMWGTPIDLSRTVASSYFQAKNDPRYG